MSLARIHSRAALGAAAPAVRVEVHLSGGLPGLTVVGLPEAAVREARERVRAALLSTGFDFPQRRITISLAPADLPKSGSRFDLAIALGILVASSQVPGERLEGCEFLGELSLGGQLRPIRGLLSAAIEVRGLDRRLVLPAGNHDEAALVRGADLRCASTLLDVVAWLEGEGELSPVRPRADTPVSSGPDLRDVIGQPAARRALEVAAAGGHHLLMIGPPGTGKTMLASRLPGLLPPLDEEQALESAAVRSLAGCRVDAAGWRQRPFRAPHHTASSIALAGGGRHPRPGEISLAHHGVLFLDELPEFPRAALEALREPLESGVITIARAAARSEFPARFQLVAAMNPCPCGFNGDPSGRCGCAGDRVERYRAKVSGPLLDRIDLQVAVPRPPEVSLELPDPPPEDSAAVRKRVARAQAVQLERAGCLNARLDGDALQDSCPLSNDARGLLEEAARRLMLSHRACHRAQRVARTIADLAGEPDIKPEHLSEALAHRQFPGAARAA